MKRSRDNMSPKDNPYWDRAGGIVKEQRRGSSILAEAATKASNEMAKLVANNRTTEAKALALEAHAVYIGIGNEFMHSMVPLIEGMKSDLQARGTPDSIAEILTGLFVAKVFKAISEAEK